MALTRPKLVGVKAYPRVAASIRRAKARGGIAGFLVTFGASYLHGATFSSACVRALVGGLAAYIVTWAAAVAIWRHLLAAQVKEKIVRARRRSSVSSP